MGIGPQALFAFVFVCALIWLGVAWGMSAPVPYKQIVVPLTDAGNVDIAKLVERVTALAGVGDVRVFPQDGEAHVRYVSKQVEVDDIFAAVREAEAGA